MVLGRSRKWCIGRFAFIGMIYAISGLLLGALLYCVLGDLICSIDVYKRQPHELCAAIRKELGWN